MIDDLDGIRLSRYLAGDCSAEEAAAVRRWIADDPARGTLVDELTQVWGMTGSRADAAGTDAAWNAMVAARDVRRVRPIRRTADAAEPAGARWGGWRPGRWSWPARIAAAIVVAAGAGVLGYSWRHDAARDLAQVEPAMRIYATGKGERAEFRLSDGSRVVLSVDSRIRVPADFGVGMRVVYLEGEALFEVRHDENRPFLVHAADAVTEDLGTQFIVRAYPGESAARVVVAEGKVALRSAAGALGTGTELLPGDVAHLDASGTPSVEGAVELDRYLAWTHGRLEFERQPLADVIPELERWYDVHITLADPAIGAIPVTIAFESETAGEAMTALARVLDVRLERSGRGIRLISPR